MFGKGPEKMKVIFMGYSNNKFCFFTKTEKAAGKVIISEDNLELFIDNNISEPELVVSTTVTGTLKNAALYIPEKYKFN